VFEGASLPVGRIHLPLPQQALPNDQQQQSQSEEHGGQGGVVPDAGLIAGHSLPFCSLMLFDVI
jgi:hypothetical protein